MALSAAVRTVCTHVIGVMLLALSGSSVVSAQMVDDATMLPGRTLFAGYIYSHDSWDQYWEGTLKRTNGNLGTVTTQSSMVYADYGLTSRVNIIAMLPHVVTDSSQGVLAGQSGWQDFTLAAKIKLIDRKIPHLGNLSVYGAGYYIVPTTNYTPDLQPLSIGTDSLRRGLRSTVSYISKQGFCITGTGAYTWREDVTLDRPYYFTNGQLFLTSDVPMPRVVDYTLSSGLNRKDKMAMFTYGKLITQGGVDSGDIRRQDFPFVANRFIASRIGGSFMYPVPHGRGLDLMFEYRHVIDGRNVGQSDTFTVGLLKRVSFRKQAKTP